MMAQGGRIGIDVATGWLEVASAAAVPGERFRNDAAGVAALLAALPPAPPVVVVEATGGCARLVVASAQDAGMPVAVVDPRQVRDFARATGRLAKTDGLDAQMLALFAERMQPEPRPPPPEPAQDLAALLARRRQPLERQTAEQQRRATVAPRLRPRLEAHLDWLRDELAARDRELAETVREDPAAQAKAAVLRSIPGVGPVVATSLVGLLPERGTLDRCRIAALAGVAPLNRDSGKRSGPRTIWGGRGAVRAALSMASLSAIRHPAFTPFSRQRKHRGKPTEVALVAVRRKLLTIANALLRDGTVWAPPVAPVP